MSLEPRQVELLDQVVPKEAVSTRQQNGINLSYLEGWYVIDRANKIFGHCEWSYTVTSIRDVQSEQKGEKGNWYVGYIARILLTVNGCCYEDVGFGQGIDRDLGKAHESASKEAITDAVKRCLKNTGMSMGLALYDKTKAGVEEDIKPQQPSRSQSAGPSAKVAEWLKKHIVAQGPSDEEKADATDGRKVLWKSFELKFGKDAERVLLGCDDLTMAQSAIKGAK